MQREPIFTGSNKYSLISPPNMVVKSALPPTSNRSQDQLLELKYGLGKKILAEKCPSLTATSLCRSWGRSTSLLTNDTSRITGSGPKKQISGVLQPNEDKKETILLLEQAEALQ